LGAAPGTKLCDTVMQNVCPTSCKAAGCGAYDETKSKVEAVHEWNWNCASGNAPEDLSSWLTGPVEGEPESSRGPFLMCTEDQGWYCPFEDGPDLKLQQSLGERQQSFGERQRSREAEKRMTV